MHVRVIVWVEDQTNIQLQVSASMCASLFVVCFRAKIFCIMWHQLPQHFTVLEENNIITKL